MNIKTTKPQRTCTGCRKRFNQDDLLAVTRLKNGALILNEPRTSSGRSVYLCKKMECLRKCRDRKGQNGIQYGLKVKPTDEFWGELEKLIK